MANPLHIEWLLEGVERWNARVAIEREKYSGFRADFTQANLREIFGERGKIVDGFIPLSYADLANADFWGADIGGADFFDADLSYANFGKADLHGGRLHHAHFEGANFEGADLDDVILTNSYLGFANLSDASLVRADLEGANLEFSTLEGASLDSADFTSANLKKAIFSGADARQAVFFEADVREVFGTFRKNDHNYTDLSTALNLTQNQIIEMVGDRSTVLPTDCVRPNSWLESVPESQAHDHNINEQRRDSLEFTESKFSSITGPFDVRWTEEGLLTANILYAVNPEPKRALPKPPVSAQIEQLHSVGQLAGQLKRSIRGNTTENASSVLGDVSGVFEVIESEVNKPEGQVLIVVIRANVFALRNLSIHKEALGIVDQVLFDSFLAESHRLFRLYPILDEIEDPHHGDLVPEQVLSPALAAVDAFIDVMREPATLAALGPSLPGVTRDLAMYPWDDDRKRVAVFAAFGVRIKSALENPPKWVQGSAQYATIISAVAAIIATIAAVAML